MTGKALPAPPQLPLVRRVVRLVDGELVHRGRPQVLGKPWRCQIYLALGDPAGESAVEVGDITIDAEQCAQPLDLLRIARLLPRQLPRHEVEDVDGDAQLEGLMAGDQRRDVVAQ